MNLRDIQYIAVGIAIGMWISLFGVSASIASQCDSGGEFNAAGTTYTCKEK